MDGQEDIAKAISNCRSQWSEAPDQPISQIAHFTRAHLYEGRVDFGQGVDRGEICQCRHCRRQCKIFASGVNFSGNNVIYNINESTKYILS